MVVYQTDVVMDTDEITEQPIFSTKAHVFQIDPETKKNWVPASKTSISVAYYYDSSRDSYRIISVEGNKTSAGTFRGTKRGAKFVPEAIVNSTITPGMTFTKTSQKFGQWSDPRANTVYGLGFSTEADLAKFVEKFKEIKELTRNAALQQPPPSSDEVNGTSDITSPPSQPTLNHQVLHQRTNSLSSLPQGDGTNLRERRNSFTQGSNSSPQANSSEAQLKYENDRLKLALAQSSSNAKKWEVELQTLKNNNARLTAALQESTSNVEEWKKQLAAYREENSRMKKKVSELDGGATEEQTSSLQQEVEELKDHVERLQEQNSLKEEEVSELRLQMEELTTKESKSASLQSRIQNLEEENHTLSLKVQDLQRLLNDSQRSQDSENRELLGIQAQLGNKITELYELHEQIVSVVKKESTS